MSFLGDRLRVQGILQGRPLLGPSTLHVDVANACNTACVSCWDHSPHLKQPRDVAWKKQRMSLETFARLLQEVGETGGFTHLILSGQGEPLTHPDCYRMLALAHARGLHTTLITNLLLADLVALRQAQPDELLISINGVTPASWAAFHPDQPAGAFDRLLGLLESLRTTGQVMKHVQVITRENADDLLEMLAFAARYQARQVTFKLASLGRGTEVCALEESQRARLIQRLPEAEARASALQVGHNLPVLRAQLEAGGLSTTPVEEVGCFMGYTYARVTVDGTVCFCCATGITVGSLEDGQRFARLWQGERWQARREQLAAGRYFDACRQCGKFNQNVKISQKLAEKVGVKARDALIGRGP